jgi:hypothetical protein
MATILGLALKINADASGVPRQLTTVERALQSLDVEAAKVTKVFETFARASGAAADVQQRFESEIKALTDALKAGDINGQQFAEGFAAIKREAADTSAAFSEGARIIEKYRTDSDRLAEATTRLDRLLELGAITQREYNAELLDASGINAQIAKAERDRADISARAARVVEANLTAAQRAQNTYNAELQEYQTLLRAGAISQDDFNKAVDRSAQSFAKATIEAGKTGTAIDTAGKGSTLQFNELSGILSALPGPLGNVAGRFSGLASAGEGLSRVFSGGLSAGISGIGSSVAALVNPFTLAVGSVAAFGAAATAVARGLVNLEDRVERLSRLSTQLGVSFEFVQVLEEAGRRADVSIEQLSGSFARLQNTLAGADEESKKAQEALQRLGVSVQDFGALSEQQRIDLIGERLAAIEDPAQRSAAAIALFGRSGVQLLPFFNELPGAATGMERFGRAVSDLDRARLADFGGGLDALSLATQGLGQTLLLPFVGLAEGIATALADVVAAITRVVDPIGRLVGPALTQLGSVIQVVGAGLNTIAGIFGVLASAIEPIGQFLLPAVVAQLVAMNAAAIAGGISGLASTFVAATTATIAYATSAGAASAATVALGTAIRATLASTGVGILVVGAGLAANALFEWFSAADKTADQMDKTGASANKAADDASKLAEESKRVAAEVTKANDALNGAIAKAGEFGQAGFDAALEFQQALADLKEQADANELNAEQYSRGVALATAEFDKQVDRLKQIQDETRKAAEEAQKRVDADRQIVDSLLEQARVNEQFGGDTSRARAADAVLAAEREIARIKESVATARDSGDTQAVAAGEERIRQLQEIQNQQAAIADGSARAAADEAKRVEDQKKRVDELIGASDTRSELEQQLIDVQEQQKLTLDQLIIARQTFNREQADAAAGRLAQLDQLQAKLEDQQQAVEQGFGEGFAKAFEETNKGIDEIIVKAEEQFGTVGALAAESLRAGVAAAQARADADKTFSAEAYEREVAQQRDIFQQRLDAANRVEEFLRNGVDARQQAELKATEELEKRKKEAAVNVQAIEAKLIEERKKLEEAREAGDLRGARAGATRVRELERVQRQEQQLADGRLRQQNQIGQQFLTGLNSAQQFQSLVTQSNDNFLKSFNNTFAGANQALAANAAAAAEQAAKLERLLTPTNQLANTADIRTQEGQQLLLDVANQGVDPALVESRLQTKQLNLIAQGISQAASNYFNSPVAIVGGAALG